MMHAFRMLAAAPRGLRLFLLVGLPLLLTLPAWAQAPTITTFSPGSGAQGSTFTLTGTNLTGTTSVLLGGQPAAFVVNSATSLTVTVPRGASTHKARVTTLGGTALSSAAFGVDKANSYTFPLVTASFSSIAVGTNSAPTVTDLDGDGLLDLLVGTYDGNLSHYEQSAANSPTFTLVAATFNGIDVGFYAAPTATDLDGDGLLDLLVGNNLGNLSHYEQSAANSPTFTLRTATLNGIDVGSNSTPTVTDLDGDGLLDLLVGEAPGNLNHYEQSAANSPTFALVTATFNGIDVGTYAAPTVTDLDGDGLLDLLVGEFDGNLNHYEQNAANSPAFTLVTASFNTIDVGGFSAPTVTDLDGDGLLDLLVGEQLGNLNHYEQVPPPPVVSSLSPTSGGVGTPVTITGTNLTGATAVQVNGTAGTITANTATSLTFTVGAGSTSGAVSVTTPGGTATGGTFTVIPAPTITSLSPGSGAQGSTFTLTGTHLTGTTSVLLGGQPAAFVVNSATSLTVTVPRGASTHQVRVTTPGGTALSGAAFGVDKVNSYAFPGVTASFNGGLDVGLNSAPTVTDLDGDGLLDLLVGEQAGNLNHYEQSAANSTTFTLVTATFNGIDVGTNSTPTVTDLDGDGLLDLLVGEQLGTLYHYEQSAANSTTFALVAAPFNSIDVFSGFSAPTVTDLDGDGLLDLLVGGRYGRLNHYEQSVANSTAFTLVTASFNGIDAGDYSAPTVTDLDGDGLLDLLVGESDGKLNHYEQVPPPVVSSLAPPSGPVGTPVTITGTNLSGATSVRFNGGTQTTLTANSATSLTAVVPASALTGPVTVTTPGGTSNGVSFTVTPSLSNLTLSAGSLSPAFAPGTTSYSLSTTSATTTLTPTNAQTSGGPITVNGTAVASGSASAAINLPAGGTTTLTVVVNPDGAGTPTTYTVSVTRSCVVTALAQSISRSLSANGTLTLTGADVDNGSSSTCGAVTLTVSPSSFSCAHVGANPVTLTVTDGFGGSSTASATVTVSAPAVSTTTWTGASSTDWTDCANWSYGQLPTSTISAELPAGMPRYPSLPAGTYATNSLRIAGGASLTTAPGATLTVMGDWANDGTATLAGAVSFAGSAATQTIGGTSATSFTALTVSKGSGTVQLLRPVTVAASLALVGGTLTTGSYPVALGSTATISETETSYVLGHVATTRLLTPGTAETFGGLGLTLTPAAGSLSPGLTPVVRTTGTVLAGVGTSQSIARYFAIEPATNAGLNVTMTFAYFDHELNNIAAANLTLFKSESSPTGPWANQGALTRQANAVTKAAITDFSLWTLGDANNPLPVELVSFTAARGGTGAVRTAWRTASEKNSAYFEVERSADGRTFAALGRVAAQGTTATPTAYAFVDNQPGTGTVYYRLRQVDVDGTAAYSAVQAVRLAAGAGAASLALWPNPARAATTVTGAGPGAAVVVYDATGRLVQAVRADPAGRVELPLAKLPAGVYQVRTSTGAAARLVLE